MRHDNSRGILDFQVIAKKVRAVLPVLMAVAMFATASVMTPDVAAQTKKKTKTTTTATAGAKKKKSSTNKKKTTNAQQTAPKKNETSSDVKRQQAQVQQEVANTRKAIKENDGNIRKGLSDLQSLQGEINVVQQRVNSLGKELQTLNGRIESLEKSISTNKAELQRLRTEYVKAVKKMRVARKQNSALTYIFSAENFSQGLRRMRYLREFSRWRDKQTKAINAKVVELQKEQEQLAQAKRTKDVTMQRENQARALLQRDYARKDALVVELKQNGNALRTHLAQKQAEANALKNRIATLIASEEATRKKQKERQTQQAQQIASANTPSSKPKNTTEKPVSSSAKPAATSAPKQTATPSAQPAQTAQAQPKDKKGSKKTTTPKPANNVSEQTSAASGNEFAAARRRSPRSKDNKNTHQANASQTVNKDVKKVPAPQPKIESPTSNGGSFERMKGSLPCPVSGHFRLKSAFGRHALPGLPDVQYDNPGIDIETGKGAQARCVYNGTVSGVYMVPGFGTVVIVSHGNYYTVYGNLASASVARGDNLKQGSVVGKVSTDSDNASMGEMHFEVWKNRDKLNPMEWIH